MSSSGVIRFSTSGRIIGHDEGAHPDIQLEKENKQLKKDILVNKHEISKLEVKLAKLQSDYEAMQLDNDKKEQKFIFLKNKIKSLSKDGAKYYKDLYNITIDENIRLKDKIEELQNELEAIKKNVIRCQLDNLKRENERLESLLHSGESFCNPYQIIDLDAIEIESSSKLEEFSRGTRRD
ncbi:46185_t:CDS:2 [Gigaspora margarita]|uniref:46185_t:CDS:1 n=1 Tax=Gigaspora margarita TaxID=4874 RepID=A0ABM8W0K0_GIGMA|nr:46185_t:CDS:2 [Gigaspora margarita]